MRYLLMVCFIPSVLFAQDGVRHSIKGDFRLPSPTHNQAFRSTMDGIADLSIGYQYPIFKGIGLGLGYQFLHTVINELAINTNQNIIAGKFYRHSPNLKLFYETALSDKIVFELATKGGYSIHSFSSNYLKNSGADPFTSNGWFLQPEMGFYMLAQDNFSVGLVFSYGISDYEFNPASIGMEEFPGYGVADYSGRIQNFSVGFSFCAYLRDDRR